MQRRIRQHKNLIEQALQILKNSVDTEAEKAINKIRKTITVFVDNKGGKRAGRKFAKRTNKDKVDEQKLSELISILNTLYDIIDKVRFGKISGKHADSIIQSFLIHSGVLKVGDTVKIICHVVKCHSKLPKGAIGMITKMPDHNGDACELEMDANYMMSGCQINNLTLEKSRVLPLDMEQTYFALHKLARKKGFKLHNIVALTWTTLEKIGNNKSVEVNETLEVFHKKFKKLIRKIKSGKITKNSSAKSILNIICPEVSCASAKELENQLSSLL